MHIHIALATNADYDQLVGLDHHATLEIIARKIADGEILVVRSGDTVIGWLDQWLKPN